MPNSRSAEKRMRNSQKRYEEKRAVKSKVRTTRKQLNDAVTAGDADAAGQRLVECYAQMDKAVKKGILVKNTVARYKSRAARKVAAMSA